MDHAEDAESEGNNNIRYQITMIDPPLRGNSTFSTQGAETHNISGSLTKSMGMDSIDSADADDSSASASASSNVDMASLEDAAVSNDISPPSTTASSQAVLAQLDSTPSIDAPLLGVATQRCSSPDNLLHDDIQIGDTTAASTNGIRSSGSSEAANGSRRHLFAEQSSFEVDQEMSVDEEDDDNDDIENDDGEDDELLSEKASSFDAQSDSDAFLPLQNDTESIHLNDDRAPLENAYAPFINPTDTCLADARERLHVALEQTRLLGASFTEQAYERYRCVMKPVPECLEEIIEPILSDPDQAAASLLGKVNKMKTQKDAEKLQAQQTGVGLEDVAYFGEGLHLVILPEDDIDESDLDIAHLSHRGPTYLETGERVEEISASAAATTEQVFDRIRRIRAMHMGVGGNESGISRSATVTHLKRNVSQDQHIVNESSSSGFAASTFLPSYPAQSMDSRDNNQLQKGALQNLLTLAPDSEGIRTDGGFTAVRSALLARGVGMHEMAQDFRINPLHQRMLQTNQFPPVFKDALLPNLLAPFELHRLKSTDARRDGIDFRSGARESIRSVVEEILFATGGAKSESAGKFIGEDNRKIDDSCSNGLWEGTTGLKRALREQRSAAEVGLFQQLHAKTYKRTPQSSSIASEPDKNNISSAKSDNIDPMLAFSVMNAVGLVSDKPRKTEEQTTPSRNAETDNAQDLGLENISGLAAVSNFFNDFSPPEIQQKRSSQNSEDDVNDKKPDHSNFNDEVCVIRGGGGQDEFGPVLPRILNENDENDTICIGLQNSAIPSKVFEHADLAPKALISVQNCTEMDSLGISHMKATVVEAETSIASDTLLSAITAETVQRVSSTCNVEHRPALSSIDPKSPFDFVASLPLQVLTNKVQSDSSTPVSNRKQPNHATNISLKDADEMETCDPSFVVDIESSPAASSPSATLDIIDSTPNGPPKRIVSRYEDLVPTHSFVTPTRPEGLHQDIADLIVHSKFHDALNLSQRKSDGSETHLVEFLLSLSAAIPISKEFIANQLVQQLDSFTNHSWLKQVVGCSSSATAWENVIVASISVWLWVGHRETCERANGDKDADFKWLATLAVEMSLSALANQHDRLCSINKGLSSSDLMTRQVAAIVSESLSKHVAVDHRLDTSFSILDDMFNLLDSLRTDALRAKTQERVLLAALAARCGNMTEAFSHAYVSSIVRAGVALGHENVCELGQDELCHASTLLPFDYFHDSFGIWEEPCRPITGYHTSLGGDEMKKQAHARSLIQKSMIKLQHRLGLKGGISDGGPYYACMPPNDICPTLPTPTSVPTIVRTPSGLLKRRGTTDLMGTNGTGDQDTTFNPDHNVEPMLFNTKDVENLPYGYHQLGLIDSGSFSSENKKRKITHIVDDNQGRETSSSFLQYRSTEELEWDDVANMFFHGGSMRGIDINYDFNSNDLLVKKSIFAPFVQVFDRSKLRLDMDTAIEPEFEEDTRDETVLQRHSDALREMKIKLDAALESRKLSSQQRGRRR